MPRITSGEHAARLLRHELDKLSKTTRSQKPSAQHRQALSPIDRLRQNMRDRPMARDQFERELISCALQTSLGISTPTDAKFQSTVTQIAEMIGKDPDMQGLVDRIRADFAAT